MKTSSGDDETGREEEEEEEKRGSLFLMTHSAFALSTCLPDPRPKSCSFSIYRPRRHRHWIVSSIDIPSIALASTSEPVQASALAVIARNSQESEADPPR